MWPPCIGLWDLFDSEEVEDHLVARQICATCPFLDECETKAQNERKLHRLTPTGTYAGRLWINGKQTDWIDGASEER